MNKNILKLIDKVRFVSEPEYPDQDIIFERFAELIKQAIYDEVKEELIPDELVDIEPDSFNRQYLKGCNGGVTDALYIIKNFGVIQDDE